MLLFAAILAAASIPAEPPAAAPNAKICPHTTSHYAWDSSKPLVPRKLTELPPGTGYMTVYRKIDGCEAPMTMVEYRSQGRRR